MRYFFWGIGIIILTAFVRLAWGITHASGALVTLNPMLVDKCTPIDIAPGTEDIAFDHLTNTVFVSAGDRRAWFEGHEGKVSSTTNGIYAFNATSPDQVIKVSPPNFDEFLPHGISFWRGEDGKRRLFVVNHPGNGREHVEIFDIAEDNLLTHLETIAFKQMHSPNDVVAVGPRQFYATNDRKYDKGPLSILELYLALPLTDAVYFDGKNGKIIAKNLNYANGINQSTDGKNIYIAEVMGRRMRTYSRDIETGTLTKTKSIRTPFGPDNLDVGPDGMVWAAGHPKGFAFQAHAQDENEISPSQVIRINPETGAIENIFTSTYGEINGSSVGAVGNGRLYVGAVFDGHILSCPLS